MIATTLALGSRLVSGATAEWRCNAHGAGQRIYFGNHSSHLDFVVIWSALPAEQRRFARPVAGSDYWQHGRLRRYLAEQVFHAVLVDRAPEGACRDQAAARVSVERIAVEMGDRYSLIVFPEGTRNRSSEIGAFKSGLYHLARLRPDAELIPVYLENLNRILPKGEVLPVPMLSRVVFGRPIVIGANEEKPEFLSRARDALTQLGACQ